MSKSNNEAVAGGPHPNPPDARAPTHGPSDSDRGRAQPYAGESEDYRAENTKNPARSNERSEPKRDS
jgi:hypothetical protein